MVDSGFPLVIADGEGRRLTPSVVHFPAPGAAPIVGHAANRARVLKPMETVYSVKRFIGRRGVEIAEEEMLVTYPIQGEGAGPVTVDIHRRPYTPEEISAEVLRKLKRDAEGMIWTNASSISWSKKSKQRAGPPWTGNPKSEIRNPKPW